MAGARVISVNTGQGFAAQWAGRIGRTAIGKRPVPGPVPVGWLGLAGDEQIDQPAHGGHDQAVYAYAREDLDWWVEQAGREIPSGAFGENLTTAGLDVSGALIGETWQLGSAVLQITSVRIPCGTFAGWMDEPHWVKRFADAGRPGAYLRVLTEGTVRAGDELRVLAQPERGQTVTVAEAMRAFYGDVPLMRQFAAAPGRSPRWDEQAAVVLGRAG